VTIRNWILTLALLPIWVAGEGVGQGQTPAAAPVRKIYTNRTAFKLPLQVEESERSRLQEIQLFVKNGPSGVWTLKDKVPPTQREFVIRGLQDGEYWFTLVTMDKAGKTNPADVHQEPPGLVVVVDRQPPEVEVRPVAVTAGQTCLQCEIHDANPDPAKSKLEYLAPNLTWQALEMAPDQPGLFRVPDPAILKGVVRATVADRAGNTTVREINLQAASAPAAIVQAAATSSTVPAVQPAVAQVPAIPPAASPTPAAPTPGPEIPAMPAAPAAAVESQSDKITTTTGRGPSAARQFINTTHATLKYQIDQQGPSGISKVEVWMTRDEGQTWQRLCEDPKRRGPVEIDLPGEGQFGISLVATNGNGLGGEPPSRGDTPDWRLEVDSTKPAAQLVSVRAGTGSEAGTIIINWTAKDKNLKPEPIDLAYSTHPEGPWLPITKGLKNDGSYRWPIPHDGAGEIYVRMEVTDLAGNSTTCTTPQPVMLDRAKPKAHVLGVVAGASSEN
jgi:hypothetical protein